MSISVIGGGCIFPSRAHRTTWSKSADTASTSSDRKLRLNPITLLLETVRSMGSKAGVAHILNAIRAHSAGESQPAPRGKFVWNPYTTSRPVGASASYDPRSVETPLASMTALYPADDGVARAAASHSPDGVRPDLSITASHPASCATATLSGCPTTPTTGPRLSAADIWTSIDPTPPAALWISTDRFVPGGAAPAAAGDAGGHAPPRDRACRAVRDTAGREAHSAAVHPGRRGRICAAGTRTRVEYPPKRVTPKTSSPAEMPATSAPTCSTTPATSNPGTIGYPTYFFALS
mmetsp:Transcript_20877/g.41770  ORF Transcript_20877/g.41770 Transcript_20877/m.41770 type:complete len:292 (+) Transcript_20877:381-1256(+)